MSDVKGKNIAIGALRAGQILMDLTDTLASLSPVTPDAHLDALGNDTSKKEAYLQKVAKSLDDLLFYPRCWDYPETKVPYTIVGLEPVVKVPLYQAFNWAKNQGYDDLPHICIMRKCQLGYSFNLYLTDLETKAFFHQAGDWLCRALDWRQSMEMVKERVHQFDGTYLIKPGQLLLVTKPRNKKRA